METTPTPTFPLQSAKPGIGGICKFKSPAGYFDCERNPGHGGRHMITILWDDEGNWETKQTSDNRRRSERG